MRVWRTPHWWHIPAMWHLGQLRPGGRYQKKKSHTKNTGRAWISTPRALQGVILPQEFFFMWSSLGDQRLCSFSIKLQLSPFLCLFYQASIVVKMTKKSPKYYKNLLEDQTLLLDGSSVYTCYVRTCFFFGPSDHFIQKQVWNYV